MTIDPYDKTKGGAWGGSVLTRRLINRAFQGALEDVETLSSQTIKSSLNAQFDEEEDNLQGLLSCLLVCTLCPTNHRSGMYLSRTVVTAVQCSPNANLPLWFSNLETEVKKHITRKDHNSVKIKHDKKVEELSSLVVSFPPKS